MRNSRQCPKCNHTEILSVKVVPDTGETRNEIRPMHVAKYKSGQSLLSGEKFSVAGQLTAAVCRKCGFTEMYATDPDKIPVDNIHVHVLTKRTDAGS